METGLKYTLLKLTKRLTELLLIIGILLCALPRVAFAVSDKKEITGKVYEFDKDSHYEFHEDATAQETGNNNTYGTFCISTIIMEIPCLILTWMRGIL